MQSADSKTSTPMQGSIGNGSGCVQVISRRLVRAEPPSVPEEIHLTPWDLRVLTVEYIQDGLVLPKPNREHRSQPEMDFFVDHLSSAFARALGCFYPLAGRLVLGERGADDDSTTVSLRCTGQGAEFVHAAAPCVTAVELTAWAPKDLPCELVSSLFPLSGLLCVDAASSDADGSRRAPLLAAQVTELADAMFVSVSLNHVVGDATTFWHFFNMWSDMARGDDAGSERPAPVLKRWFPENYLVPVPLQLEKVERVLRHRGQPPPLQECAFQFSAESLKKLKGRANAEVARSGVATATVSSLQALLAHLWRSVCRARCLEPSQKTSYVQFIGCRGMVKGVPLTGYVGNAVFPCIVTSTAGEVLEKGLGWTSWLLSSAVASFDEATLVRESLDRWVQEQWFPPVAAAQSVADIVTEHSPRFDVYGNDFGWGKPVAVRGGRDNTADGKSAVYEGRGGGGAIYLEVCLAPDAMAKLIVGQAFMDEVTAPPYP